MVGDNLASLLNELQLTPEEFGDKVGVGKSPIYKLLRGDTKKITRRMAERMNLVFPQYEIDYLLSLNYNQETKTDNDITQYSEEYLEKINNDSKFELSPKLLELFEKAILLKEEELLKSSIVATWIANKELVAENKLLKIIKLNKED